MQAAAVGRIGTNGRPVHQTGIGAALGAVTVHDVERRLGYPARNMAECGYVAPSDVAAHGTAAEPEPEMRLEIGQHGFRPGPSGGGIDDQADLMAACQLASGEIDDVPEQPAYRSPQYVKDPERSGSPLRHDLRTIARPRRWYPPGVRDSRPARCRAWPARRLGDGARPAGVAHAA